MKNITNVGSFRLLLNLTDACCMTSRATSVIERRCCWPYLLSWQLAIKFSLVGSKSVHARGVSVSLGVHSWLYAVSWLGMPHVTFTRVVWGSRRLDGHVMCHGCDRKSRLLCALWDLGRPFDGSKMQSWPPWGDCSRIETSCWLRWCFAPCHYLTELVVNTDAVWNSHA